ncbi:MAG TPA: single-stranded-DNA-specific exonuclease RecJ [Patescibacteria group bacterium]|nr:single-stranded-DNA-specific exonuclease RecJ [Patescibacteria group bacterium]
MKKWRILHELEDRKNIFHTLLANRGITQQAIDAFLHPNLAEVTLESVGIDNKQLISLLKRLDSAKERNETIIIYGDYDVDGVTATAIVWETLHGLGYQVHPYIPNRTDEGYGLSVKGIENLLKTYPKATCIITVDNGIVAHEAVNFANEKNIDIIITDHHLPSEKVPQAYAILHTTKLCGAGVAWIVCKEILKKVQDDKPNDHLSLIALATVADLVPLTGTNRILLTYGLQELQKTKRPGLLALFQEAQIKTENIGVYEIGHVIAPRLNAMGRIASAMDSLRLLCTRNAQRAKALALKLDTTNRERQLLTQVTSDGARNSVFQMTEKKKLLFLSDESYDEGIIGLVAGKMVEAFYRPTIIVAKGLKISKGSARSVAGFNIIEFIRTAEHLLINAGGHPMAAGFTVATENLVTLQQHYEILADGQLTDGQLDRELVIDCVIPLQLVSQELFDEIHQLAPFGMGNKEPVFVSDVVVKDSILIGNGKKHLKLKVSQHKLPYAIDAIAFGMGEIGEAIKKGDMISIAYTINENKWNGKKSLQLRVKDIKVQNKS